MRVMVIVKANEESERGDTPSTEMLQQMADYNDELVKAGVMLAGEGLLPSSRGFRVSWTADGKLVRTDGPFAEAKELVAGFWIIEVDSLADAVGWARQVPNPRPGRTAELEVRRVVEAEDFGDAFTPEARAAEERMRERLANLD
jgi:hypothetical protein